jgi:hypothetical protein
MLAGMKCFLPLVLVLVSCTSSNVVQTGPNSYLVAKSSAAGAFANTSKLKIGAIEEANRFAAKQGKIAVGTGSDERRPIIGGFPSYEYRFTLVNP